MEVGLLSFITKRLALAIADRVFPGGVVGLVHSNGGQQIVPVGRLTYDLDSPLVETETVYDLASLTKSVVGTSLLLQLIDSGQVKLNDPLVRYVPEFGTEENKQAVTIWHLLTYTLDLELPALSELARTGHSAEAIWETVFKAPLKCPPGSHHVYANPTALLIGLVVEKVTGSRLDRLAAEKFFNPLGMARTNYSPETHLSAGIAPTEIDDIWRKREVRGVVHDEAAFVLGKKRPTAIAGLFSTAPDLLKFLAMLLNKGIKGGRKYFSANLVEAMSTNQLEGSINRTAGLGWAIGQSEMIDLPDDRRIFYKSGFTG
ncbi:MAG: serine hydrolase domain-containing protein, partial [Patescibacteria group bacterium]